MKDSNQCFYHKFIDEEKCQALEDYKIYQKFWVSAFSIPCFSLCAVTFPTFIGYNFQNLFATIMFCFTLLWCFFFLYFTVKFLYLDHIYKVFKKKWQPYLLVSLILVLTIVFMVLPVFTVTQLSNSDTFFHVSLNPAFYFLIYWPLFIGLIFFYYYAFMKCFAKYMNLYKKKRQ